MVETPFNTKAVSEALTLNQAIEKEGDPYGSSGAHPLLVKEGLVPRVQQYKV